MSSMGSMRVCELGMSSFGLVQRYIYPDCSDTLCIMSYQIGHGCLCTDISGRSLMVAAF